MGFRHTFVLMAAVALVPGVAGAATRQVGPTRAYRTVADAVYAASDGDTIEIDSGRYVTSDAWGIYYKNSLTFRGVGPTRPVFDARNGACNAQGIFVLYGSNTTVENIEFCNARDKFYKNASGIRLVGAGLTLRNCYIHDCDDGVLTGANSSSDVVIENCEFDHCGYIDLITGQGDPYGQSHNIYIGNVRSFTIRDSWTHNAVEGHNIKTRAKANYILYNRISDENGTSSYEITVPNGGTTYIIGNMIQQGPNSRNSTIIDYASEGGSNADQHLYVVNNTIVNERTGGPDTFVRNSSYNAKAVVLVQNNIFQHQEGDILVAGSGSIAQVANWATLDAGLRDTGNFNYRLTPASSGAIDAGSPVPAGLAGYVMAPSRQYVHPYSTMARPAGAAIDIGAYEYAPNQAPTVSLGDDLEVYEGQPVNLYAAAADPDGDPLTYSWTQTSGLGITLTGAGTILSFVAPVLTGPADGVQAFQVDVSDGLLSASDSVGVRIWMAGDCTRDDAVDVEDLLTLAASWGSVSGDGNYDAACDFNGDGAVDVADLLALAGNWDKTLE